MTLRTFFQSKRCCLGLLFAVALVVRLLYLGRAELWQDEMLLVQTANPAATPVQVWQSYRQIAVSMAWLPLPAVIENIYLRALQSVAANLVSIPFYIRLPGALAGALAVPCIAGLGFLIGGRRLGWGAGLWAALTFFFVFYSREVHAYPLLLLLSALNWLVLARFWNTEKQHIAYYLLFGLLQIGLALTHLTAALMIACAGAATFWFAVSAWLRHERPQSRHFLYVSIGQGAGLLAVAPYYFSILTQNNPHLATHTQTPFHLMMYDFFSKIMFGEHLWAALAGFIILIAGVVTAWRLSRSARSLVIAAGLSLVLIALAARRTQYLSARYFMVVVPVFAVFVVAGLLGLGSGIGRLFRLSGKGTGICASAFMAMALIPHLTLFLPPYYRLTAKSVDFGSIAQWLNKNLEPGQPYLMESAYELRFVGGYFPTSGKTGASPYVHGGGPDEMQRLHESQQQFMNRFPDAPFIESAHHNWENPGGVWKWPHQFHARHIQLRNEPLRSLIQLGIYPGMPHESVTDYSYVTDIYYSTPEDIAQRARGRAATAIFRWAGWSCIPYAQDPRDRSLEYGWMAPGALAKLSLENLSGTPVKGRIRLELAAAAPGGSVDIYLRLPQGAPLTFRRSAGQFQFLETPEIELPAGGLNLDVGVSGVRVASVQGILIRDAQFLRSEEKP